MHSVKYSNIKDPKSRENIIKMMVLLTNAKDPFLMGVFKDLFDLTGEKEAINAMRLAAIENEDLEMVKTIGDLVKEKCIEIDETCIQALMKSGNVEITKWLRDWDIVNITDKDIKTCVSNGNTELFEYLYGCGEINYEMLVQSTFTALTAKHFGILKVVRDKTIYRPLISYLRKAVNVDLETVKVVHSIFGAERRHNNEWESQAMIKACVKGKEDILEWLVSEFWVSKEVFDDCIDILSKAKNISAIKLLSYHHPEMDACQVCFEVASKMGLLPELAAYYREHESMEFQNDMRRAKKHCHVEFLKWAGEELHDLIKDGLVGLLYKQESFGDPDLRSATMDWLDAL